MTRRQNWTSEPWRDSEQLECAMVIPEAPDCATIAFRAPSGAWFDYQPGQFLTLDLPLPGGTISRSYTISSSPSRPLSLSVTVKAQPGSQGSRWLIESLRPGMRLKARGPLGEFTLLRHFSPKYLMISAGSGITPMMSMTTWAWDAGEMPDIVFVHAARPRSSFAAGLSNSRPARRGCSCAFASRLWTRSRSGPAIAGGSTRSCWG